MCRGSVYFAAYVDNCCGGKQMQSLLLRIAQELPVGCLKADVRAEWEKNGQWKRMVEAAT